VSLDRVPVPTGIGYMGVDSKRRKVVPPLSKYGPDSLIVRDTKEKRRKNSKKVRTSIRTLLLQRFSRNQYRVLIGPVIHPQSAMAKRRPGQVVRSGLQVKAA
jgi:hypothetical protein